MHNREGKKTVLKDKTNQFWNVNIKEEHLCQEVFVSQHPGPAPAPDHGLALPGQAPGSIIPHRQPGNYM